MKLFVSLLITLSVGIIAGLFTRTAVHGWYALANKPSFNPPNWLFGPVWTILYIMMGIALWLVWKTEAEKTIKQTALILFAVQLMLNFIWSFIFFYYQQTGWALADIILLWLAILCTIIWFNKITSTAAWLLVPYIFWVSFASLLNYYIWQHN